jgi:hypothetical protein
MHLVSRHVRLGVVLVLFTGAAALGDSPTLWQILAGQSQNDLLHKCKDLRLPESPDPPAPLPAKVKGAVNFLGPSGIDTAPFLAAGAIRWPEVLAEAKAPRTRLVKALSAARKEAATGKVSDKTIKEVRHALEELDKHLVDQIGEISPSQYIESKRLVNRLKEASKAVERASLRDDLALAVRAAKETTTAGLIRLMNEKKLKFAAALPGQEEAYQELYKALADHHRKASARRK